MLQLLIGRSGSGKTHAIVERLDALAAMGHQPILWLVPEQHSFESERALLEKLGPVKAAQVQVLSFSRLADMVFREVGGLAEETLDEGTRALLMSRALEQVAAVAADADDPMRGLRPRMATDSTYVEQLLQLWQELRQCNVSTTDWERVAAELAEEDGAEALFAAKVGDLSRVFAAYEGLSTATGVDELDKLTRLADKLADSRLPDGATVFVDGFKGFTVQEMAVLEAFMPRCSEMTVALGTDTPGADWPGVDRVACRREHTLFSPVTATVRQLRRVAEDRHGLTWELTLLDQNYRTEDEALRAVETGLYAPQPKVYEGDASAVTITPCADVYEECRYVTRRIRHLLREEGYRCREITVVARNLEAYQGILDEMLTREGIPCFMDQRQELLCEPLVAYLRSALQLAAEGWRTEGVLRLLKTDLWPLSAVQIAELENYVYMWRIEGKAWEQEWTENPSGLDGDMHTSDRILLERLNTYRRTLMASLSALRQDLRGSVSGRQFAMAVYRWLSEQKELPRRIARQAAVLEELAQPVLADHATRLWDEIIRILDRFALALGDQRLPISRMVDLFTMLCRFIDLGAIPQGLDAVTVGNANRIRYRNPRAVFVLGANEGVFPTYPMGDGLLTEEERRRLKDKHLTLAEDVLTQCVEERYYAYMAVAAPREQLTLTYLTAAESGPSPVVTAIERMVLHHTKGVAVCADGSDLETAAEMFSRMAQGYGEPSATTATLRAVMAADPAYAGRLAAVERGAAGGSFRIADTDKARDLFGSHMVLSASQATQFYQCRFRYFCNYGLRVEPRKVAQLDSGIFGTLVHYAMEVLIPTYAAPRGLIARLRDAVTAPTVEAELMDALRQDVHRVLGEYIDAHMGGTAEKSGRFLYQLNLAERSACNMLWHTLKEFQQSSFDPVDFELTIHPAEDTTSDGILSVRLPIDGGSVQVRGSVDRVDLYVRADGTAYVRVVDYKTGSTRFDLCELTEGLGMQMLVYLFVLCDNSRRYLEDTGELRPAGVLYHPLSDLVVDRGKSDAERLRRMRMSGLVLDDPAVVLAMEAEGQSHFIPAKLNKEGQPTGNVVSLRHFTLLRGVVEKLLRQMGETLLCGDVAALPLRKGDTVPCQYCDYRAVCGRDPEDPVRELIKKNMSEVLEDLETQEEVTTNG